MPLKTEDIDLEETLEDKREELDDVAAEAVDTDPQSVDYALLEEQGSELETHINALEWAVENWDVETITLAGMTGGEHAKLVNEVEKNANGLADGRIAAIVHGTEDAPYMVYEDDSNTIDEPATYRQVGQLPLDVHKYLETVIDDLTSPGSTKTSYRELVMRKRAAIAEEEADG